MENSIALQKLAENIIKLRIENNLTQLQLANAAGKDLKVIRLLEQGKGDPDIVDLIRLAKAMNIPGHLLVEGI